MSVCRLCTAPLSHVAVDFGVTPMANAYLSPAQLGAMEPHYPLRMFVCERCYLAQLEAFVPAETIFSEYAYFSSYSETLLEQSRLYAEAMCARLELGPGDRVIEVASNDGYLLRFFVEKGLDVLGVEPAANIAEAARARGIPTLTRFFGREAAHAVAADGPRPRLVVANNVMAHVPDLDDFVAGLAVLLAPGGTLTVEFHHLLSLVEKCQFDTIYHEHFQYFSLATARAALEKHGLAVVDVEETPAQGGSLRVFARHAGEAEARPSRAVDAMLAREEAAGLRTLTRYDAFAREVARIKLELLAFLVAARQQGRTVVCYGAAAKGNTLLNACGVRADLIDAAVDRSPHKQGLYLPGSRIPIRHPDAVREIKPDYLLLLPWNLRDEIVQQMAHIREWGGRFVVPVPSLQVLP